MTQNQKGWIVFVAALGMMLGLLSPEIAALPNWGATAEPLFVAKVLGHLGAVIAAFVAGRLMPNP